MADEPIQGAKWPTIPQPSTDAVSMQRTLVALKEAVELLTGQRGPAEEYSLDSNVKTLRKQTQFGLQKVTAAVTELVEVVANENQAIAQRTEILEAEIEGARGGEVNLAAKVTQLDSARVEGDEANARSITTVEAKADDATNLAASGTASGQVALQATASPSGYQASYSWTIAANQYTVGMRAMVKSDGTAVIAFKANQFYLEDPVIPGGIGNVFGYYQGRFTFNVPVTFNGDVLINGSVQGLKMGDGSISNMSAGEGGLMATAIVNVRRASSRVLVLAFYSGSYPAYSLMLGGPGNMEVFRDGVSLGQVALCYDVIGTGSDATLCPGPTATMFFDSPGATGFKAYTVIGRPPTYEGSVRIVVLELSV